MSELASPPRLRVLRRLQLLDSGPEAAYDRLTRLATRLLGVPLALVVLVDEDRQFFKSAEGLPDPLRTERQTPLTRSFCRHVVEEERPLVIEDARSDERVRANPAIDALKVVGYLGVPLTVGGEVVGASCAIDHAPRAWTPEDVALLGDLAAMVGTEMELRLAGVEAAARAEEAERERAAKDAILASVGEAVYAVDADGCCTFVNPIAAVLLGCEPSALVGRDVRGLLHRDGDASVVTAALRGGTLRHVETVLWRADGAPLPVEHSVAPVWIGGRITGAVGSFRDLTERKRDQALFEGQAALLERIAGGAPLQEVLDALARFAEGLMPGVSCAILLVDGDKRLRPLSAPSLPEAYVRAIDGLEIGPDVGSCGTAAYRGEPVFVEDARRSPPWVRFDAVAAAHGLRACWSTPVFSTEHEVVATFALYDRAPRLPSALEHRLMQIGGHLAGIAIERARREEALREANRRKDEFLAMLAHELRNPLAPILTGLQIMKMRGDTTAVREREVIERQARHLVRLVDDLLDISRVTRGKVSLDRRPLDLRAVVSHAVETVSPLFEERRHRLTVSMPPEPVEVEADLHRLSQVVANLLTNAARYTPNGGRVDLTVTTDGGEAFVRVRDDGHGMPPDLLARAFEPFVQGEQSLDRRSGGLGLGLPLARSLARLHGGDVTASSAGEGRGSEFEVRIPRLAPRAEPAPPRANRAAQATDSRRVLVVDDNPDAASLLADALATLGYEPAVAYDGPSALALARTFRPHVGLLDIGLPVMDGFELARRLRADLAGQPLLLLAVSGYGQDSDIRKSRAAGFDDHFVKPADIGAIVARIARAFEAPPEAEPA